MKQLILGGARSGKSQLAESLAQESGKKVIYIATATADDHEMQERIKRHQQQRPSHWQTIECQVALSETLRQHASEHHCLLIDCLTLWTSNLLCADHNCQAAHMELLTTIKQLPGDIIFVSNEVGLGVIPMGSLSRRFVDESGRLHQALASQCERVIFTAAGLPLVLKGEPL